VIIALKVLGLFALLFRELFGTDEPRAAILVSSGIAFALIAGLWRRINIARVITVIGALAVVVVGALGTGYTVVSTWHSMPGAAQLYFVVKMLVLITYAAWESMYLMRSDIRSKFKNGAVPDSSVNQSAL
jgi:hypothetical protein